MRLLPSRRSDVVGFVVLAVLLAVFPLMAPLSWVNVGVYALIYAIAAIGLTLLMGLAGQVSLGQASFFAIGAYTQGILVTRYGWSGIPSAVVAVLLASLAAFVLGLALLRLRGHYLALGTLGLGIIITVFATESDFTGGTSGIFGIPKPEFNGRTYDEPAEFFWLLIPVVVVALLVARNIVTSRVGRALGAVNDSEVAAETLGVDTFRLRLQVFTLSAAYAGLAGVFFAHWLAVVNPNAANFPLSVKFLLISVLGGLGTVWGAVVGGFLVEFLDEGMKTLIPQLIPGATGEVQLLGFGIVLVLVIILLPGGLHQAWLTLSGALGGRGRPAAEPPPRPAADGAPSPPGAATGPTDESPLFVRDGRPEPGSTLLEVRGLTKRFGGVVAVDDVDLDVRAGEILALIGPNGAGKTTCFNMVSGVLTPTSGSVTLDGHRIEGKKPHVFARSRATRTFQNLQGFGSATVLGNVMVGRHLRSRSGMLRGALLAPARREERQIAQAALDTVELVGLRDEAAVPAADLPFGRQRLMEVARALALEPDLLLLDEPMAGLSADERRALAQLLRRLRAGGMAIVLVEHDVEAVLALADRVAVLDDGRLIALGSPDEIRADPAVIAAYLGVDEHDTEAEDAVRQMSGESGGGRA
ncbi:MAG TPA: branched-chain amino acid ABC transporter ATP-binding protein/permease [Nocardioidaceae bacterium]|nr:branched-chain amino acid ABC transporter ATP-binding protein/permease [Nocardioidaceae bacterium]